MGMLPDKSYLIDNRPREDVLLRLTDLLHVVHLPDLLHVVQMTDLLQVVELTEGGDGGGAARYSATYTFLAGYISDSLRCSNIFTDGSGSL